MKKVITLLISVLILISSLQLGALTAGAVGGFEYRFIGKEKAEITGYNGAQGKKPTIPKKIKGKKVVSIGAFAFSPKKGNKKIVSVKIPKTVKIIKHDAFKNSPIKSVKIPKSVKKICARAFESSKLKKITIPSSVIKVGEGVFRKCKKLKKVVIGSGLKRIGNSMFSKCSKLKKIKIPKSVKEIGEYAFKNCGIKKIKISKNIKKIGKEAFLCDSYNQKLEEFDVDKGNKKYSSQDGVLFNKDKTKLIAYPANRGGGPNRSKYYQLPPILTPEQEEARAYIIPDGVEKIEKNAFKGTNILTVEIPGSIEKINKGAFAGAKDLTEAAIGEGVVSIDKKAFYECYDLAKVMLPKTIERIEEKAFLYSGVDTIHFPQDLKYIGKEAFLGTALSSIAIPRNIEKIGNKAFGFDPGKDGKPGRTNKKFTVKGYKETKAEDYALKYNFTFKQLINLPRDDESNFPVWVVITASALFLTAAVILIIRIRKRNRRIKKAKV